MITNEMYWNALARIDPASRNRMKSRGEKLANSSERMQVIRGEIPYNPLQIMREASRLAVSTGLRDGELWSLNNCGACVCDATDPYATTFSSKRRDDVEPSDADKFAALDVLAQVCEYVRKMEKT